MKKRVVITGMGVVAPNAHGLDAFTQALRKGISGIRWVPELAALNFSCQVGGIPQDFEQTRKRYFDHEKLMSINDNIGYASVSAIDAWTDAGFQVPDAEDDHVDWDAGVIAGSGIGGMDTIARTVVPMVNEGKVRRMGSRIVEPWAPRRALLPALRGRCPVRTADSMPMMREDAVILRPISHRVSSSESSGIPASQLWAWCF